jgi:dUTP pyrophosphatase
MLDENSLLGVKVILMNETAKKPSRGTKYSAGYDLYASIDETIVWEDIGHDGSNEVIKHRTVYVYPEERLLISTGVVFGIRKGFVGIIKPRSGLALRHGIDVLAGVIDSDYRGIVGVVLQNHGSDKFRVDDGDRIAQIIFIPHERPDIVECSDLSQLPSTGDDARGGGGFGSTGVK